jgi:putative transposase
VAVEVVYPWWRNLKRYMPEVLEELGWRPGFDVIRRRWVVERTFAWLGRNRRLSKDCERLTETGESLVYLAMSRLMPRRLAKT